MAEALLRESMLINTRDVLIRCGMELLTERGFAATAIDTVLQRATVPKGSFYHYFSSKAEFVRDVVQAYDTYWTRKLDRWLLNESRPPIKRLTDFITDAKTGLEKHRFLRGCLIGNLSQDVGSLPTIYRSLLQDILGGWQERVSRCLKLAQERSEIASTLDCDTLAEYFWIGWEGAVMRARLTQSTAPLDTFFNGFLAGLQCQSE